MHEDCGRPLQAVFAEVLASERYVLGPHLAGFEREYAAFTGVSHCAGVKNGFDALVLSLRALGIGPGDEVVVSAHTFISSVLAVLHVGAVPKLAEPNPATYNSTAADFAPLITPKTKALMPVHIYGQACEMVNIMVLARENGLYVVEDCAQATGATFGGKRAGSYGDLNASSFYPTKNLGALGDAGAVTTHREDLWQRVNALRNVGITAPFKHSEAGVNARLDELQAAFLAVKLGFLKKWNAERWQHAAFYRAQLAGIEGLILPQTAKGASHVYHQFVVRTNKRDELAAFLQAKGIGTHMHYPVPVHLQPAIRHLGYKKGSLPITEEICRTCLSLPIFPGLTEAQLAYVVEQLKCFFKQ